MNFFRKFVANIFAKIVVGLVLISFVAFGVSDFILGGRGQWVAKVGNSEISLNSFNQALKSDRELILASNNSPEALKYVGSQRFQSDVVNRLVSRKIIEKLHDEFGVSADKDIILKAIAKDPSFKNEQGKFDENLFKNFLKKHSLSEDRYVTEIANEVTATIIMQSLSLAAPVNFNDVLQNENFKKEKRVADVVTLSIAQANLESEPTTKELEEFYNGRKEQYVAPETRAISLLTFAKNDFAADFKISENEILAEYEKSKDQFLLPEKRSFYQIVFEQKEQAESFLSKLQKADKNKIKDEFARLAKEEQGKNIKNISLEKISKKDMLPDLADATFALPLNQLSQVLPSALGYHVFLNLEIKPAQPLTFEQAKNSVKKSLETNREDKVLQAKFAQIDDSLITAKSLDEVAKKFKLSGQVKTIEIDSSGKNSKGEEIAEIAEIKQLPANAFALKKGQNSKIFYANSRDKFYVLRVEDIKAQTQKKFAEISDLVKRDFVNYRKTQILLDLSKKVAQELKQSPEKAEEIAKKYGAKFEKNREFPRFLTSNFQGKTFDYRDKFLDQIFALKLNQASDFVETSQSNYSAAILRQIKAGTVDSSQFEAAKNKAQQEFLSEVMQEFEAYLLEKHPVKINQKLFEQQAEQESSQK